MNPLHSRLGLVIVCVFAYQVLGQNVEKTISDCICNNVTLMFDLHERKNDTVESYIWYKYDGQADPSFARYKVAEKEFRIFRDDVQDRLLHNRKDSSQLKNVVLLNVQKSDASKYVIVINYANVSLLSSKAVLHLAVKDLCFGKPKQIEGCAVSTCFTGENGKLTMNNMTTLTVNGFSVVRNCATGITTSYTCCNALGCCKEQIFQAISVLGQRVEKTTSSCISNNVTLMFDLHERKNDTVESYIWYKYDGQADPSFARYKVAEKEFRIFRDDVQDRLLINFDYSSQPKNVVLLNVQKSDASKYVLVINYADFTLQSTEAILRLAVKDLCFGKPKQIEGCAVSTCFAGENGKLTMNNMTTLTVNGFSVVRNCTTGITTSYTCCNALGCCKEQIFQAISVLGQRVEKTTSDCISNNVTLMFDLPESKDQTVESYIWYKYDGQADPSFARYKVAEKEFRIFRDDVEDRLLHNPDDSSQLKNVVLLNVQKSDASKYVIVINYANVTLQSSDQVLHLSVKSLCFGKPKQIEGCAVSTCFTGENGKLTMNNMTTQKVNGFSVVKNCTTGITTSYTCCNTLGYCKEQTFQAISVLGQIVQKNIIGCISDNVTLMIDLPESKNQTVESYIWYKYDGQGDPSFARYKVAEKEFRIFRDDVQDRLLHNPDDSSQLKNVVLLNVQKSDASKYVIVINYADVTLLSSEAALNLSVKSLCFGKPKQIEGCAVSTCFTGENGKLTMNQKEKLAVGSWYI